MHLPAAAFRPPPLPPLLPHANHIHAPFHRPCPAHGCAGQTGGSCAAADGATEAHR
jgi:hypothetical protein